MSRQPKIEIKKGELADGNQVTQIFIDGHKINGVRYFKLEQTALDIPVLTLDINAIHLSIDTCGKIVHDELGEIESITFKNGQIFDGPGAFRVG